MPQPLKLIDTPNYYVAECIVNVSAQLAPEFADWPSNIQDGVYAAIYQLSERTGRNYALYRAWCDYDVDAGWYVCAVARAPVTLQ